MPARQLRSVRRLAVVICTVLIGAVSGCGSTSSVQSDAKVNLSEISPPPKGAISQLTWALNVEPSTLDPIYSYNFYDDQVLSNMCESLLRLNPDLTTSPLLAEKIENPTPTSWVYDIRKGVKFWDGNELTAADVVYSLSRNLDPKLGSYFVDYYRYVKDITQTGRYQVTVDLTQPYALWNPTLVVGGSSIMEKAWAIKQGKRIGSPSAGLMCTGPYELASWNRGSGIDLERNPDYWDTSRRALAADVSFRALESPSAQTQALLSGGAEGQFLIDPSGLPALSSSSGKLYFGKSLMLNYLAPTRVHSPLDDVDVRKALALIIDRPGIAKSIYNGAAEPMRTLVTPTVWGSNPAIRKIYESEWKALKMYAEPNVAMAKKLFEDAGSPSTPITLAFPSGGAEQQIAESVQSTANQIGLNIELKAYSPASIANLYYDQKAQVAAGIDLIFVPLDVDVADPAGLYQLYIPNVESVYNYSGYSNPKVTTLLEKAVRAYDPVQRARLTAAAERIVMDDMPMIPLVSPDVMAYMNDRVTGAPTSFSIYWSAWANRVGAAAAP